MPSFSPNSASSQYPWIEGSDETDLPENSNPLGKAQDCRASGRLTAATASILADAVREQARLETHLELLPLELQPGAYRYMGLAEASGWLSASGIRLSPAALTRWQRSPWSLDDPVQYQMIESSLAYATLWQRSAWRPAIIELSKILGILSVNFSLSGLSRWADAHQLRAGQGKASELASGRWPDCLRLADAYSSWRSTTSPTPTAFSSLAATAAITGLQLTPKPCMLSLWAGADAHTVPSPPDEWTNDLPNIASSSLSRIGAIRQDLYAPFLLLAKEAALTQLRGLAAGRSAFLTATELASASRKDHAAHIKDAFIAVWTNTTMSARDIERQLDISYPSALKLLDTLCAAHALREITKNNSFRLFAVA